MHSKILSKEQLEILPLIKEFYEDFYLVGGTAIALHICHRRSIDFALFKYTDINHRKILNRIEKFHRNYIITRRTDEQLNVIVNNVNLTFLEFPYEIEAKYNFEDIAKLPDLLTLAAMKSFTLGRRAKWKDYIDLYFILKYHYTFNDISVKAKKIFKDLFSEKLFRAQMSYFEDIDFSEKIEFLEGASVSEKNIKDFLIEIAISEF